MMLSVLDEPEAKSVEVNKLADNVSVSQSSTSVTCPPLSDRFN